MYPHKGYSTITSSSNRAPNAVPVVIDNQWISQSAYQNVDTSTVDWAAVAQQWIHMKESFGAVNNDEHFPDVPLPPRISQSIDYEEQGEAPMEVEHDDDIPVPLTVPSPPKNAFSSNSCSNNSESSNQQKPNKKQWNSKRNRWGSMNQSKNHTNDDNYVTGQVFTSKRENNSSNMEITSNVTSSSDTKFQKTDKNMKSGITQVEQVVLNAMPPLDAAQRKTLPAWIREGLEKMEREKMRQAERDREMKERDEKRRQERLLEKSLLMQFNTNDSAPTIPAKSKFDSESESDNDETVNSDCNESVSKDTNTATFVSSTTMGNVTGGSCSEITATTIKPHRSKADIITEIMLSVRKNLTDILLEVTNEEIHAIAQETLTKMRSKGPKTQTVQKNVLSAKTSLLGLVTYDDSDGSHSDDDSGDDYDASRQKNDDDSESELKRTILSRKQAFENKSIEIESYLAKTEERERLWLEQNDDENVKANDTNHSIESAIEPAHHSYSINNEIQPLSVQSNTTKLQTDASKAERKGSRFSDAKGLCSQTLLNANAANQYNRSNCEDKMTSSTELKRSESKRDRSESDSDSSWKRYSKPSRHHSKKYSSRSPSKRAHKHKHRHRSSSSSSDRSNYSKQSKSSHSSHKYDRYSKDRNQGHRSSRRFSRSRSHSSDRHSKRRHH